MSAFSFTDAVGILGAGLIVAAYFLLQVGRLDFDSLSFSVVNGAGAGGIIYSLLYDFNLSAFAIEIFWLAISLYGIFRALRLRKTSANDSKDKRSN